MAIKHTRAASVGNIPRIGADDWNADHTEPGIEDVTGLQDALDAKVDVLPTDYYDATFALNPGWVAVYAYITLTRKQGRIYMEGIIAPDFDAPGNWGDIMFVFPSSFAPDIPSLGIPAFTANLISLSGNEALPGLLVLNDMGDGTCGVLGIPNLLGGDPQAGMFLHANWEPAT